MRLSRHSFAIAALWVAAAILVMPVTGWAQSANTGSVTGRVLDESKAAVPGATVTARNEATGLSRTGMSSANGTYRLGSLPSGSYEISFELTGFAKQIRKGVPVQVDSASTVDVTMSVSSQAETITVTGETALVSTTTSDVGQVITQRMVENLPMNGRKFQDLSLLVPGTRQGNYYDPTKTEVGGVSFGGLQGRSVIINVDGGDNNDGVVRGLLQQFSADAIQEYKVTTQRYSAEYGRSVGGVVNVITKSGTNDIHGTLFGFGRNESLNSKTYFEKLANAEKSPFSQQQFGATLGGPIVKDKAHYFLSYEYNHRKDTAQVFTNGVLPDQEGFQEKPFRNHLITAKTDFQLNDKNTMTVRYSREDQKRENDFIGGNALKSNGALNTNKIDSAVAKNTTTIGASKLNELLVLYQHFTNNITANDPADPQVVTPDFTFGANVNTPQQTIQKRLQVRDDFSFRKEGWGGDHDFKVGAELLRSHYGGFFIPTLYGFFNFANSIPGANLNTYLNSIADSFTGTAGTNQADDNWTYLAGYLQDDWKPTRNFTVNLGLRYEVQYGPYSNKFRTVGKDALAAAGYPSELKNDTNNFGPRIGFAWDVKGDASLVARGGYGRYYDEIYQNITLYEAWSDPATPLNFVSASPTPWTPAFYAANREAIRNSFLDPTFAGQQVRLSAPDLVQPLADHFNAGFTIAPAKGLAFDVHASGKQEVARWDIDTPENLNTRISPVGRFAPQYNRIVVEGNRGHSTFDGVYVAGKLRAHRATLLSTYTWSKAKNIADDFFGRPGDISNLNWEGDIGPTPNDVRHRVTTGGVLELPAGFQLSSGFQWNTGKPYNASAGLAGRRNAVRAIDPATGQPFPRYSFTGPDYLSLDARLSKVFKFGNAKSFEVLFECFNLTNHVNFNGDANQGFINTYSSANFGTATQIIANSQRQAEFGARFRF
jgi:outer membrane receptor protein involved in Fe transport